MKSYRKHSLASALALAVSLTACGGGGGLVSNLPPPTPTPTPTPSDASIGDAAQATLPDPSLFPQAKTGGPTIDEHSLTSFPLIESAVTIDSTGLVAAQSSSGNLKFEWTGNTGDEYSLNVPGLGISNLEMAAGGSYCYSAACGETAYGHVELDIADPATTNLSWTTYGFWTSQQYGTGAPTITSAFVTGYRTPTASVPTSGTATYTGSVEGRLMSANANSYLGVGVDWLSGDATLQADFASGDISGNLTNMTGPGGAWNSVSLLGAISGGDFTGTTAATTSPGTVGSMSSSATGTFAGAFFGPSAQELGAVWTLHDGTSTAIGTIGGSKGP